MADRDASKTCAACGREFAWRRRWARCWEQVRYCSERCRRRSRRLDRDLDTAIRALLGGRSGTICPSEAARRVGGERWRELMEPARRAGRRLAQRGEVVFLQRGRAVDPARARGAIRLGRGSAFPA